MLCYKEGKRFWVVLIEKRFPCVAGLNLVVSVGADQVAKRRRFPVNRRSGYAMIAYKHKI
jgi:hypothetical protein